MVFTGSSQALSYVDGASVPNTWADLLEGSDNKRLSALETAFGQCRGRLLQRQKSLLATLCPFFSRPKQSLVLGQNET